MVTSKSIHDFKREFENNNNNNRGATLVVWKNGTISAIRAGGKIPKNTFLN